MVAYHNPDYYMPEKTISHPRDFPAVEELLQHPDLADAVSLVSRPIAADVIRDVVADTKHRLIETERPLTLDSLLTAIRGALRAMRREATTRVINATGIIVHTNLGRAPLSPELFDAVKNTVTGYGNTEFSLATGRRGGRGGAAERYLATLAESEAATVVNNCAAGLFLTLNTLANRKEVLLSRGEMVQIGGGFRIPDILRKSGGKLREVGTTNITTLADYESNIDPARTGLILKVHKSNFIQAGFTEEVPLRDLVTLGNRHHIPVMNDLGSGVFVDTRPILGYAEPTVQQSVRTGAVITSFSGDKLLGGVQAGLLVGTADAIRKIKKNPLFRTMRADKIVFSMLEHLSSIYLSGTWQSDIKLWRILSLPEADLYKRGKQILADLGKPSGLSVEATEAYVGGGALPEAAIPSVAVFFSKDHNANTLLNKFRNRDLPVIGRIENDRFLLDLKAIDPEDLTALTASIKAILGDRS